MRSLNNHRKPKAGFESSLASGETPVVSVILSSAQVANTRIAAPYAVLTNQRICLVKDKAFGGSKIVDSVGLDEFGYVEGSAAGGFGCLDLTGADVKLWFNDAQTALEYEDAIRDQRVD